MFPLSSTKGRVSFLTVISLLTTSGFIEADVTKFRRESGVKFRGDNGGGGGERFGTLPPSDILVDRSLLSENVTISESTYMISLLSVDSAKVLNREFIPFRL